MNHRPALTATGLLALGVVLTGCTSQATGAPTPQSSLTTTTPSKPGTATTSRLLPPRPQNIDISGLDPCKALTTDQEKQLGYDLGWQRPPIPDHDNVTDTPNCSYSSSQRQFGSLISFVVNEDAQTWLTAPERKTGVAPKVTVISGFPALQITVPTSEEFHNNCQVVVDVHSGQYINVFSNQSTGGHATGSQPFCEEAMKVAAMVLENAESR